MPTRYSLAVIRSHPNPLVAVELDGAYYPLAAVAPDLQHDPARGIADLLASWPAAHQRILGAIADTTPFTGSRMPQPAPDSFAPPVTVPGKVLCCGMNYWDHLRLDAKIFNFDKGASDVLFFMKHGGAVVGSGKSVRYPSQSHKLDWEVELVAIFGASGRRIPAAQALDHVAGYCVGIDLSARDWQASPRHLKQFDLLAGKSFDDSAPIGPRFVPAAFVDPSALHLALSVNGKQKQNSSTREMIWSVSEQIAQLSQIMTVEPGDLLFTGSPAGVGMASNTFLAVGDKIVASIEGLGELAIEIVPDPDADRAPRA